jgi:hypothetical protein
LEDAEDAGGESSPPKQVFATLTGVDDDEDDETYKTPASAAIPATAHSEAPPRARTHETPEPSQGPSLRFYEGMPVEELIQVASEKGEHVQQPDVPTTPITPDTVDPVALEAARVKILEEADGIIKISASVLQDKVDTKSLVDRARKNWDESNKALLNARKSVEE